MERYCSTRQSPQWAVAPMEEEEEVIISFNDCIVTFYFIY